MRAWGGILVLTTLQVVIICKDQNDYTDGEHHDVIRSGATYTIPSGVIHNGDGGVPWFVWLLVLIFIMFVTFVAVLCFLRCSDNDGGDGSKLCYLCYSRVAASDWKLHRQSCMHENNEILDKMVISSNVNCGTCGGYLRLWPPNRVSPFTCGNKDCRHFEKPVMTNIRYNCFLCDFDLCGKCSNVSVASEPSELVKLAAQGKAMLSPLLLAAEPILLDGQSTGKAYPEPQVGMLVDLDSVDGGGESLIMDTREATVAYPAKKTFNAPSSPLLDHSAIDSSNAPRSPLIDHSAIDSSNAARSPLIDHSAIDSFNAPRSPLQDHSRNPGRDSSLRARSMPRRSSSRRQSLGIRHNLSIEVPTAHQYAKTNSDIARYSPPLSPLRPVNKSNDVEEMSHRHSSYMSPPIYLSNFDTVRRHSTSMSPRHGNIPRRSPPVSPRRTFTGDIIPNQSPSLSPRRGEIMPRQSSPMSPHRLEMMPRQSPPMSPSRVLNADIMARQSPRLLNPGSEDGWSEQYQRDYGARQLEEGDLIVSGPVEDDTIFYPGMHCRRNPLYFNY